MTHLGGIFICDERNYALFLVILLMELIGITMTTGCC